MLVEVVVNKANSQILLLYEALQPQRVEIVAGAVISSRQYNEFFFQLQALILELLD
jgi:major membrane immunogen (membrane-anchored lipoprotein)